MYREVYGAASGERYVAAVKATDPPAIFYKRWLLRDGVALDDVVALVSQRVVPHYRRLDDTVTLRLEAEGERAVLAIQRWPSRGAFDRAMEGPGFEDWWDAYRPVLVEWDALVELDTEWETRQLIR